jgi:hypothetical protein
VSWILDKYNGRAVEELEAPQGLQWRFMVTGHDSEVEVWVTVDLKDSDLELLVNSGGNREIFVNDLGRGRWAWVEILHPETSCGLLRASVDLPGGPRSLQTMLLEFTDTVVPERLPRAGLTGTQVDLVLTAVREIREWVSA